MCVQCWKASTFPPVLRSVTDGRPYGEVWTLISALFCPFRVLFRSATCASFGLERISNRVTVPFWILWPHHANNVSSYLFECGDPITLTLCHLTFLNVVTLTVLSYHLKCGHANSVTVPSWMWWFHHANTASSYLFECGDSITQTQRHLTFLNVVTPSHKHYVILPSWMW